MITEGEVYYQENFQVDAFMHQHFGQRVFYTDPSEREEAWKLARTIVKEQFKKYNPHLFEGNIQVFTMPQELPIQHIDKIENHIDLEINEISKCKSIEELSVYKILAQSNKSIRAAYDLRLFTLKNKSLPNTI